MLCTICGNSIVNPIGSVVDGDHRVCTACVLKAVKRAMLFDDGILVTVTSCDYCQYEEIRHLEENLVEKVCFLVLNEISISTSYGSEFGSTIPQWCPLR